MKILSADFGGAEPALAICPQCTCGAKVGAEPALAICSQCTCGAKVAAISL